MLEQLGGPAELRRSATAREWASRPPRDVDALNVMAVRYLPDDRRFAALPDDAFAHDGQLTKQAMRAVTLAALAPRPGELLWDVGAGSGSIAIEWCRSGTRLPGSRVRTGCASGASGSSTTPMAFGVDVDVHVRRAGVVRLRAAARRDLRRRRGQPAGPARAPAGRSSPSGGRLVANAVTVESEAVLAQWYSRLGGELRRFQHYRGEPVGAFTGWRPAMPVTQWVGDQAVTVYFIGAGPGAADLITVRGQRLLSRCPVCLYAGSIMPEDLLACARRTRR